MSSKQVKKINKISFNGVIKESNTTLNFDLKDIVLQKKSDLDKTGLK